jgi:hypothetical protein
MLIMSAIAPATSTPVGPPPTNQSRVAVDMFEDPQDSGAQVGGVVQRVQRERVLGGTRRMKEIRLRARREHQRVPRPFPAIGRPDRLCLGVKRGDLGELDVYVVLVREDFA